MIIELKIALILAFLVSSICIISLISTKNIYKLLVFTSILTDCVILIFLLFRSDSLNLNYSESKTMSENYAIVLIIVKFMLLVVYTFFMKKYIDDNKSIEKDFRPKHYD